MNRRKSEKQKVAKLTENHTKNPIQAIEGRKGVSKMRVREFKL